MPMLLISRTRLKTSRTIRGARPSEGSSISRSFGAETSARAIATICLLPAAEGAGDSGRGAPRSRGKRSNISSMRRSTRALVGDGEAAEPQVVHDGERVPQLPALGHPGDARHVDLVRLQAQEVDLAIEAHLAGARTQEAEQRLDDGGLARATGAQDIRAAFARQNLQRDAVVTARHRAVRHCQTP